MDPHHNTILLSFAVAPLEFFSHHVNTSAFLLGIVYLFLIYYLISRHLRASRLLNLKSENFKEEINTLNAQIKKQKSVQASLERKITHYNNLRSIANKIQDLSLQQICHHLVGYAFYLLGKSKGACLLYLVDPERQKLNLFLSEKEDKDLVIKQKQGDVFDRWVIRHSSSLLIEDSRIDFRFDLEKTEYRPKRPVLSLISAPLKVEQRFLGILRLDNYEPYFYSQDDLRFLDSISNIGALGLENALLFQRIQELAIRDSLTSTFTKGYFLERLNDEIKRTARISKEMSLLMIDIDNFKDYNDKYGHIAGDILLKELGRQFLDFSDKISGSMVCRFGGEEFAVFLPGVSEEESKELARLLRQKTQEKRFILRREETSVTISIGLAYLAAGMTNAQDLILKADAALYKAKQRGKNQVCTM
ncbi:MAG: sensor domain-containing diguanylate cyclase [Candidatus Omnitrophota bacterium]